MHEQRNIYASYLSNIYVANLFYIIICGYVGECVHTFASEAERNFPASNKSRFDRSVLILT